MTIQEWHSPVVVVVGLAIFIIETSLVAIAVLLWRLTEIMQEAVRDMRHARHDVKEHATALDMDALEDEDEIDSIPSSEIGESESTLRHSRDQFQQCLLGGGDVDVSKLMTACRDFAEALSVMGRFAKPIIRQVDGNVQKIATGLYHSDPEKYRSMRILLQGERDAGKHRHDAVLADPSAAMGLLWSRRALMFWNVLFSFVTKDEGLGKVGGGEVPLKKYGEAAYDQVLKPFNGFISRKSFSSAVLSCMPAWSEVGPKLAPREVLRADMIDWMTTVSEVLVRMEAIQREANLEDLRKSI